MFVEAVGMFVRGVGTTGGQSGSCIQQSWNAAVSNVCESVLIIPESVGAIGNPTFFGIPFYFSTEARRRRSRSPKLISTSVTRSQEPSMQRTSPRTAMFAKARMISLTAFSGATKE